MEKELKIAVLIDAENISSKYAGIILQEAAGLGNIIYKRIYGNWTTTQLNSWKNVMLENAIQPVQQYSNTAGKNSSDSALIIDAMDLLYQHRLDAFCIVSSDSDFTRLATRLRESEMFVLGMGEQKTPRSFISACNKFSYLDLLYKATGNESKPGRSRRSKSKELASANNGGVATNGPLAEKPKDKDIKPAGKQEKNRKQASQDRKEQERAAKATVEAAAAATDQSLDALDDEESYGEGWDITVVTDVLREIAEERCGDDGWIQSGNLGQFISKRLPDFDSRNFGFKKFTQFVESLSLFETKVIPGNEGGKIYYFRLIEE